MQRWLEKLPIWQAAVFGFCAGFVTAGITAQILGLAFNHNLDTSPGMWGAVTGAGIGSAGGETWRRLRMRKRAGREVERQWQRARQDALAYNSGVPYDQVVTGPSRVPEMPANSHQQPAAKDPDAGRPWEPPR